MRTGLLLLLAYASGCEGTVAPPPGLSVHLEASDQKYTGVEIVCGRGYRHHEEVVSSRARFEPFPVEESCLLVFKGGGPPSDWGPAPANGAVRCAFTSVGGGYSTVSGCVEIDASTALPADGRDLVLVLAEPSDFNSAEVECPSGFRLERDLDGPTVTYPRVPEEDCALMFRGRGAPRQVRPVRGGQALTCTFEERRAPRCTP